jgi:excisionase family DNA binding protein
LKTTQAANYLAVSPWQLRKLIAQGQIPVVQVHNGARFLLDVRDLDGYIERNKVTRDSR